MNSTLRRLLFLAACVIQGAFCDFSSSESRPSPSDPSRRRLISCSDIGIDCQVMKEISVAYASGGQGLLFYSDFAFDPLHVDLSYPLPQDLLFEEEPALLAVNKRLYVLGSGQDGSAGGYSVLLSLIRRSDGDLGTINALLLFPPSNEILY